MTAMKRTLLGLLALVVASSVQAQTIDCSGGCTETRYGMGFDLDLYDTNERIFNKEQWTGSYLAGRSPRTLTGPSCGPESEGVTQPIWGQIVIREQDDCVMDSVGDGVGCLVELPFDSALGRSGYLQLGQALLNLPIGIFSLRQALFADFEGSIGERILDTNSPGGTRIHWGSEVGGPLRLVRDLKEGANCCSSSTQTLCTPFGFEEYPLLSTPANVIDVRVLTPDWIFEGGAGTRFETDIDYVVPGQEEGVCAANRDRSCGTVGDLVAGSENGKCVGAPPCASADALASACDDVAFGGVAGDTCDLSEQGFRPNDITLINGGAPDTARCNNAPYNIRGFPNENCWFDDEYAVNGDPLPGCQVFNFGRFMRPDQNCDGIEDDTDGDGQPGPDLCPGFSEFNPFADANGDGIGDQCQCGDANEDGAITGIDIGGMALCANNGTLCDFRISDTDDDGTITSLDISGVVAVVNGTAPTSALLCGGSNVNVFD